MILGLGLLTSVVSARSLGPEGRGIFAIAIATSGFAVVVLGLGLPRAFPYFIARDPLAAWEAWRLTLYAGVALGATTAAVGALLVHLMLTNQGQARAVMVGLAAVPMAIISANVAGMLQGLRLVRQFNVARLITPAMYAILLILWALHRPGGALGAVVVYLLACTAGMAVAVRMLHKRLREKHERRPGFARPVLRYALTANIGSVAYVANSSLMLVTLGFVTSASEVGLFAVAMGYSLPVSAGATAIAFHTSPQIATSAPEAQQALGRRRALVAFKTTLVLAVAAGLLAPAAIPFVFGDAFSDAVLLAELLVLAQAAFGVSFVLQETSRGLGKPQFPAIAESAGLLMTLLATVIVVPRAGLISAAAALLVVNVAVGVMVYGRLQRHFVQAAASAQ